MDPPYGDVKQVPSFGWTGHPHVAFFMDWLNPGARHDDGLSRGSETRSQREESAPRLCAVTCPRYPSTACKEASSEHWTWLNGQAWLFFGVGAATSCGVCVRVKDPSEAPRRGGLPRGVEEMAVAKAAKAARAGRRWVEVGMMISDSCVREARRGTMLRKRSFEPGWLYAAPSISGSLAEASRGPWWAPGEVSR